MTDLTPREDHCQQCSKPIKRTNPPWAHSDGKTYRHNCDPCSPERPCAQCAYVKKLESELERMGKCLEETAPSPTQIPADCHTLNYTEMSDGFLQYWGERLDGRDCDHFEGPIVLECKSCSGELAEILRLYLEEHVAVAMLAAREKGGSGD